MARCANRGLHCQLGVCLIVLAAFTGLVLVGGDAAANDQSSAKAQPRGPGPDAPLNPAIRISQYSHTAWRIQDGSFSGVPHAITQTADGYLWIGTDAGVVRFDGSRFVPWVPPADAALPSTTVYSLFGARDGSLWIGTSRSLAHWKNGRLIEFPSIIGRINSVLEDAQGATWMVRSRLGGTVKGALCRVQDSDVRCYGEAVGMACANADALIRDGPGNLWLGGSDALCRWSSDGVASSYLRRELKQTQGLVGVSALAAATDGTLFVGIDRSGANLGLRQFAGGAWKTFRAPGMDGATLEVTALFNDRSGSLWIGTTNDGVYRVNDGRTDHFRSADGLTSDSIENFYQDREGNLWVVTSTGIDRFRDFRVTSFSRREGLTADRVHAVLGGRDGRVWIGNEGALDVLRQDQLSSISARNGMPGKIITSLLEDHLGRLWVGVDGDLAVYESGRFRVVKKSNGSAIGIVGSMTEDADHNIWAAIVGQRRMLVRIEELKVREEIPTSRTPLASTISADARGGLWLGLAHGDLAHYKNGQLETFSLNHRPDAGAVRNLMVDSDGSVWAVTDHGILRWKDGAIRTLDSKNGLPCDSVFAAIRDDRASLWLYTGCGLVAITNAELTMWLDRPGTKLTPEHVFDVFDGALPAHSTFSPSASKSRDGRLWFANDSVLQMVDPNHLDENYLSPPVRVEQIVADRVTYPPQDDLHLPALTRDIEIDYTALSLTIPQKVSFRYKLEGRDYVWGDPLARRQAFYSNLKPGTYRFRVTACNNDGVWNETGATLAFTIPPSFTQSASFKALCLIAIVSIVSLAYRIRVRQVTKRIRERTFERLAERERIARDLHDTFFQGIQGLLLRFHTATSQLHEEEPARTIFEETLRQSDQVMLEGRELVLDLRMTASEVNDLPTAFADYGEQLRENHSCDFKVVVNGNVRPLRPVVFEEISRIGKETLGNAFRHSGARSIEAELNFEPNELRMRIRDDGAGIDPNILKQGGRDGHWGMPGMRERARKIGANLDLWSRTGAGTEIELRIAAALAYVPEPKGPVSNKQRRFWRWRSGAKADSNND